MSLESVVRIHLLEQLRTGRTGVCPNQKYIVHRLGEYPKVGNRSARTFMGRVAGGAIRVTSSQGIL
jgi:hypothetical protein